MKTTLAIFSPNENAYSETFIHAHKNLPFNIKFYYGGGLPTNLEASPSLFKFSLKARIKKRFNRAFSLSEHALMNSLVSEKVCCVLAEYGPTACNTLKIVEFLRLPLVVHFHGFDATNKEVISDYREQYTKVFAYASAIVAVSRKMKADLIALGCPEEKMVVTPCGPNADFFKIEPSYTSQQFVAIARMIDIKGPLQTILAFKKTLDSFPQAKLVMIGDGQLLNTCKYMAKSLRITDNVVFRGVLNSNEIQQTLRESIAFLQHSFTLEGGVTEGSPVAVMEAQAAGLPVVSTIHAGIPDVVVHEQTGLLVNEFDIDEMANHMVRLLSENGLAKKMGEAARQRTAEQFSMDKHLAVLSNTISDAVSVK